MPQVELLEHGWLMVGVENLLDSWLDGCNLVLDATAKCIDCSLCRTLLCNPAWAKCHSISAVKQQWLAV